MIKAIKTRKTPRTARLVARVTPRDKAVISRAAALVGQSVCGFVVAQARKAAIAALATERIVLNAEQSRRFVEALLAPPRPPTARMLAAMRAYRATVKSDLD